MLHASADAPLPDPTMSEPGLTRTGHAPIGPHRATGLRMRRSALALLAFCTTLAGIGAFVTAAPSAGAQSVDLPGSPVAFGDAGSFGAAPAHPVGPVVGMAATASGNGYWIVASDGGIFTFGDASFHGSMGGSFHATPIVGMAATPDGAGYWEVAADGGIFTFGDANFYGSMGGQHLNAPIVGMAATPDGRGYFEVASAGGIFTFGDASFHGSAVGVSRASIVTMSLDSDGGGYWLAAANGGVFTFGDANFYGSMGGQSLASPIVGMVRSPDSGGYWLLPSQAPQELLGLAPLALGSRGPAVAAMQQRLTNLGYWLGTPDGVFGDSTQQAVWAFQKAAGVSPSGVVGLSTYVALAEGVEPQPQSHSGYVIEVDLHDDLVMFVNNGQLLYTLNTSTGGGYYYDGGTLAATPVGHFNIFRAVDGQVVDSLGALWRPRFFSGGFAIHGDSNVPPVPVSHGCVRVSDEAIDWIWANTLAPIGAAVWVY